MYTHNTQIRIRYGETDRMGYAYYGNYAQYFEVARVELLRSLGMSYKQMEDDGILLPVLDYQVKFLKPVFYDDLLNIKTTIQNLPLARIVFKYEVFNEAKVLTTFGQTTLVFIDKITTKPARPPHELLKNLAQYF